MNKDGRIDIVTPTKFGTFIFWGQGRRYGPRASEWLESRLDRSGAEVLLSFAEPTTRMHWRI